MQKYKKGKKKANEYCFFIAYPQQLVKKCINSQPEKDSNSMFLHYFHVVKI